MHTPPRSRSRSRHTVASSPGCHTVASSPGIDVLPGQAAASVAADVVGGLAAPSVGAEIARRHGALDLPVLAALQPLQQRLLCTYPYFSRFVAGFPFVVVPVSWPTDAAQLSFFREVIAAAQIRTTARTSSGLEQRAFEALCSLARGEAALLRRHGQGSKADVWLKALSRTAAMRTNVSHFGRAIMIQTVRGPPRHHASFRQVSLREAVAVRAPSPAEAAVAAADTSWLDARG